MKQLLNWFRRGNLESSLDRELRYHIDRRVSDLMLSGLSEQEPEGRRTWNSAASHRFGRKSATFG